MNTKIIRIVLAILFISLIIMGFEYYDCDKPKKITIVSDAPKEFAIFYDELKFSNLLGIYTTNITIDDVPCGKECNITIQHDCKCYIAQLKCSKGVVGWVLKI